MQLLLWIVTENENAHRARGRRMKPRRAPIGAHISTVLSARAQGRGTETLAKEPWRKWTDIKSPWCSSGYRNGNDSERASGQVNRHCSRYRKQVKGGEDRVQVSRAGYRCQVPQAERRSYCLSCGPFIVERRAAPAGEWPITVYPHTWSMFGPPPPPPRPQPLVPFPVAGSWGL